MVTRHSPDTLHDRTVEVSGIREIALSGATPLFGLLMALLGLGLSAILVIVFILIRQIPTPLLP